MRHNWLGMTVLCGLLTLPIASAQEKAPKTDKDAIQGTWLVVAVEKEGKKAEVTKDMESTLTFSGDKATFKSEKTDKEGAFKIDAAKKPKEIDLTNPKSDAKQMIKGIYELDAETLKIAFPTRNDGGRPAGFDGKEIVILTLKRKK